MHDCTGPTNNADNNFSTSFFLSLVIPSCCLHHAEHCQWGKRTPHKYIYKKGSKIIGCDDFSAISPSTGWSELLPPPQWIWSLWYLLFISSFQAARLLHLVPLLPGGGGGILLVASFHYSEILRRQAEAASCWTASTEYRRGQ